MTHPKSKRRATSPAQPGPAKIARTDTNGESKLTREPEPESTASPARAVPESPASSRQSTTSDSSLSALAPVFVPRGSSTSTSTSTSTSSSAVQSPVISKKTALPPPASPAKAKAEDKPKAPKPSQTTLTPTLFRPVFKSEPIIVEDSTFQARLFRLENTNSQRTRILGHMKRNYDAQHHMAAWRCLILKDGMTGLEGEHAFVVEAGCCDDGESRGGKTVMDILDKSGLCDVIVVVSRWFGGTMLGPARFRHIADCARVVCSAMFEQERAKERAAKVADLVAQLREWDTEVADLRTDIAALERKQKSEAREGDADKQEEAKEPGEKQPTVSVSLKPPDYTTVLNPPDVEKAERLLQARRKTVQTLKTALDKKRQKKDNAE